MDVDYYLFFVSDGGEGMLEILSKVLGVKKMKIDVFGFFGDLVLV